VAGELQLAALAAVAAFAALTSFAALTAAPADRRR
jgi:hypothetical protein